VRFKGFIAVMAFLLGKRISDSEAAWSLCKKMYLLNSKLVKLIWLSAICFLIGSLARGLARTAESRAAFVASAAVETSTVTTEHAAKETGGHHEEHGLPQRAVEIGRVGGLPITNSMVVTWVVALALIIFAQFATRNMKRIPEGAQNFWEWLVESLSKFLEGIIGPHLVQRTFWFFASVFIFILFANWAGLIPGIGTIGWNVQLSDGSTEWRPLLRGANADLNMTLAMALVFFACWILWALLEVGPVGFAKELFGPKGENTGFLKVLMIVVFFAAGCLEVISILFRPVSLSFRLYGNIFAGENMLETMSRLVPGFGWLLPIPFYFLELLVGLVQALVFMLLTAVFTLLICQHEEPEHAAAHE
jgi:F-type H+-transporting ATPase subunit a